MQAWAERLAREVGSSTQIVFPTAGEPWQVEFKLAKSCPVTNETVGYHGCSADGDSQEAYPRSPSVPRAVLWYTWSIVSRRNLLQSVSPTMGESSHTMVHETVAVERTRANGGAERQTVVMENLRTSPVAHIGERAVEIGLKSRQYPRGRERRQSRPMYAEMSPVLRGGEASWLARDAYAGRRGRARARCSEKTRA
ncbi:hypothetical protein FKP32DRAFT_1431901 [Trametes sanguinea]|nr:hypothetical protein FKP32DRAFT_1431901 [Trametes sanguinea]